MQKGLGIAALVIAIIAMFIPFLGTWLTVLVGLLAAFAYGPGLGLGIASIAINITHIFFFSPLLWVSQVAAIGATAGMTEIMKHNSNSGINVLPPPSEPVFLPWILIAAQIGAGILLYVLHKKRKNQAIPLSENRI